jgi:hypothetical protein
VVASQCEPPVALERVQAREAEPLRAAEEEQAQVAERRLVVKFLAASLRVILEVLNRGEAYHVIRSCRSSQR